MNNNADIRGVKTLVELLRVRAESDPEKYVYAFLPENESAEEVRLTHLELDRRARAIAALLQQHQLAAGERVLLLYPPGLEFIAAFFGCLYAGAIAVPAYPPRRGSDLPRLEALQADAGATFALTTAKILATVHSHSNNGNGLRSVRWLVSEDVSDGACEQWREPVLTPDTIAFLQYTSGSTTAPRGAVITHESVLSNATVINRFFETTPMSDAVFWLPFYHDMGLIGGILQPLFCGCSTAFIAPMTFLQSPFRWLQEISKRKAIISGGPNFAYDLCARTVTPEQRATLDLSHWQLAFNGAEPVRAETMDRFAEIFAPCGFRREAFYPCYGLAEATLLVSGGKRGMPSARMLVDQGALARNVILASHNSSGRTLISNGQIAAEFDARIVDPESRAQCASDAIGEVWLRGQPVAGSYWNKPDATAETFCAHLADSGEGPFLRTGDLGFLQDGELYITGRIKDLMIIRGQNYYAHDIERTVQESEAGARVGGCAVVGVEVDGAERLVIVVEARRRTEPAAAAIAGQMAAAVAQMHALQVHRVVFVKPGGIPRTSSGKTRRPACRDRLLARELDVITEWTAGGHNEAVCPAESDRGADVEGPNDRSRQTADEIVAWLREYAGSRINSRLIDERRSIPPYVVLDLGNRGVLGMEVPRTYDGLELRTRDALRVVEQLAAIDLTIASFVGVNNVLGVRPIIKFAPAAMRAELLPLLARGRELAAFALTEPGAGSNPRAMAASALSNGSDAWRLHGTKSWIGSGSWAGIVNVFVRLGEGQRDTDEGITAFAVRQGTKGLRQGAESLTMGMRGMVQNTIHFEDVPVTRADMLGTIGTGFGVAQDAMLSGRLGIGAMSVGAMKRCAQLMLRYATRREVATGRLIDNPVTLMAMGHLTGATAAVDALVSRIANLMDSGHTVPPEAYAACKIAGPEFLWAAADSLVQMLGGRGYIETNIAPQMLRDARLLRIFEGPTETLEMYLGASADGVALRRFLSEDLASANVARELQIAIDEVMTRAKSSAGGFTDPLARRRWALWQLGKVATCSVLWAAVQWEAQSNRSARLERATEWARLRFVEAKRQALSGSPAEATVLDAAGTSEWVASYADAVGDVEQTLEGEDQELDPMLRRGLVVQESLAARVIAFPRIEDKPPDTAKAVDVNEVAAQLRAFLAKAMRLPEEMIDIAQPLRNLGLDSLVAVELKHHVEQHHGTVVSITDFLGDMTLFQLAEQVVRSQARPIVAERTSAAFLGEDPGEFPLSQGQQALWLLNQLAPESSAYNVGVRFLIEGGLDIPAMELALQAVVHRHPMLRATIHSRSGEPVQCIAADSTVQLRVVDAEGLSESELQLRASDEARRPFDLVTGPLMRAVVYERTGASIFLLVLHHIIEDSWSLGTILYELSQCYRSARRSLPVDLPPVVSHYRDYVRWQQKMLTGEAGDAHWTFWKDQLEGAPFALNLPTDRPRPLVQGYRGATFDMPVDGNLYGALKALSKTEGVTLFTTLLAAFQVLLHRYSQQQDICIGSPMTGRGRAEWSSVVGYFVNPVVLRGRFESDPIFRDFLQRMRIVVQGAFEHQDYPFPRLVERLQPRRDPGLSPLFQVMFTLQKELAENLGLITGGRAPAAAALDLDGASLQALPLDAGFAQFDLSLMMTESSTGLTAKFEYNTDLFDALTIERMAGHFRMLLASIVRTPDEHVALLPMLTHAEEIELRKWSGASESIPLSKATTRSTVDFSLFYFSCDENDSAGEKYRLLLEGARFADRAGFAAVWTPERHFHSFGGLYPNPSVLGSALAMITRHVRIRAGSVVLPLHNPMRVAEEWAVVDNLSNGRVDLAFAAGWNATDFVFAPGHHADRKQVLRSSVETVRRLWRGESIAATDGAGDETHVRVFPLPVQKELPVWITCGASAESFIAAGAMGANVLTALLLQSVDELKDRIQLYREARHQHGHDAGHVTLMLHTLVGENLEEVRDHVRQPFMDYLRSSVELWSHSVKKLEDLTEHEREDLLQYSFERYCRTSTLFGTPDSCVPLVERLRDIGVDEIASLIDFGVDANVVLSGLESLNILRQRFMPIAAGALIAPTCEGDEEAVQTIHGLIAAQAVLTPDAIAVACETEQITYRELDAHANAIAQRLIQLGIGPEVTVGLLLERSATMVGAILGVLKAGGAYVPLDPAYPPARLAFMISDAKIGVIFANQKLVSNLPPHEAHVVLIEEEFEGGDLRPIAVEAEGLAYVLYTSGSTGRPKGVQVSHGAVVNFLRSMQHELGITAADRLLAVTRLSFDIAGLELLLPLTVGATVVIAREAVTADACELIATLDRSSITLMQATPATWRMMLDAGWQGRPQLTILCGGEMLPRELAERLLAMGARLWNLYGPTETTIWSSCGVVESGEGAVSIGNPIANTQLYVLDAKSQFLPLGVPGELCIGGSGLARGYLNQPELTADRFIPDPFSDLTGARLYRTGDAVRRLTNGQLEFLGRIDHQIKIRGHRIELGEIEVALTAHPAAREALVIVCEETPGDQRLVAYLLTGGELLPSPEAMRAFLQESLPEYMLPSEYVSLDEWPLTANGKIDRKALPRPQRVRAIAPAHASRSRLESDIAAVWEDVLRIQSVGMDENFFDLGGHSLLLAQVHSRLRDRLKLEVSMVDLFRYPTVGSLAATLAGAAKSENAFRSQVEDRIRMRRTRFERTHPATLKPAEDGQPV